MPSRSPPIQEPNFTTCGRSLASISQAVLVAQCAGDFFEQLRQGFEDGDVVIIEAKFNFVLDGGAMAANFVGLPERGDFREDVFFASGQFFILQRNLIQAFEGLAEASAA